MNTNQSDDFESVFEDINNFLLNYGWMVGPRILGGELKHLRALCMQARNAPPTDTQSRSLIERELNASLLNITFHPTYRAHYACGAMRTAHVLRFSHFIERAILNYYKGDYLSCAICLLPAAEGVLRSHYEAIRGSQQKIRFSDLHDFLSNLPPQRGSVYREMYGRILSRFLMRWLFPNTTSADFSLSHLNRHYALHGLGTESFYRAADCHRLFLFFDIYTELLAEESGQAQPFISYGDPQLDRRRELYFRILSGRSMDVRQLIQEEAALMKEHPNFKPEANAPSMVESFARFAKNMLGLGLELQADHDKESK